MLMDFVKEGGEGVLASLHFCLVSNIQKLTDNSEEHGYEGSNLEMPSDMVILTFVPYPPLDASTDLVHKILTH